MSYDRMVFDPASAPATPEEFMEWYEADTESSEDHLYDDPAVCTPALQAWFSAMIQEFPAMNGPWAGRTQPPDDNESRITDYSIYPTAIYAGFAWSVAEVASERVAALAAEHGVALVDFDNEPPSVWVPDGQGGLKLLYELSVG